jgi:uncharacterized peroxidase-related enzyme
VLSDIASYELDRYPHPSQTKGTDMSLIKSAEPETATGKTAELLEEAREEFGAIPNSVKTMAASPAVLEGYIRLADSLEGSELSGAVAERIAIGVAQLNQCGYCLSAHSYIAEKVLRLEPAELDRARRFESNDERAAAVLEFAQAVAVSRGASEADVKNARAKGLGDAELAEVVALVAISVFTNYFNITFDVDVDFPRVDPHEHPLPG